MEVEVASTQWFSWPGGGRLVRGFWSVTFWLVVLNGLLVTNAMDGHISNLSPYNLILTRMLVTILKTTELRKQGDSKHGTRFIPFHNPE